MKKRIILLIIVALIGGVAQILCAKEGNLYLGETLVCDESFAGAF